MGLSQDYSIWKQLIKPENGQDFCLVDSDFIEDFKTEFAETTDTTVGALIGNSFAKVNGFYVISTEQRKIVFDYLDNYEDPAP